MFKDLLEILQETFRRLAASRLFVLAVCFTVMFAVLITKLFQLQIVEGVSHLNEYIQKTDKVVTIAGTRGNIYDRNGSVLAYNELAYMVTIRDIGVYPKGAQRNAMLVKLLGISLASRPSDFS